MCERVPLTDVAEELGCSKQAVREHMKRKIWDLGELIAVSGFLGINPVDFADKPSEKGV